MNDLIKKLRFDKLQEVLILNAPDEFNPVMKELAKTTNVEAAVGKKKTYAAMLIFVNKEEDVRNAASTIMNTLIDDGLLWLVYPKKSSKKYKPEISRDNGWQSMGDIGFEPVSLISIDDDWSALRFRKAENIKKMSRSESFAMSATGKNKTTDRGAKVSKKSN